MTTHTFGFRDLPINDERDDALDLCHQAQALAKYIQSCDTPMTIGIQGDWGSGKTSLMNLIRGKLPPEAYLGIWFNTWQYSQFGNDENLSASLLLNLLSQIKRTEQFPAGASDFIKSLLKSIVKATSLAATAGPVGASFSGKDFLDEFLDTGRLDQATHFDRMKEDFAKLIDALCLTPRQQEIKSGIFRQTEIIPPFDRVVIYIDDLDRLPPVRAVELLEVLKNIVDVPGCVFVLAIDYSVVVSGLRERKGYGDNAPGVVGDERKFFDKIIQVPYIMPSGTYKLEALLARLANASSQVVLPRDFIDSAAPTIIANSIGRNPRTLKRALNIHALFGHMLDVDASTSPEMRSLASALAFVFACVQVSMPALYELLTKAHDPVLAIDVLKRSDQLIRLVEQSNTDLLTSMEEYLAEQGHEAEGGIVDAISTLARELVATKLDHQRVQIIATCCIDYMHKQTALSIDQRHQALTKAIVLTKRTALEGDLPAVPEQDVPSKFFGFLEMAAVLPELENYPNLIFEHPRSSIELPKICVRPDYESASRHLRVLGDDDTLQTLAEKTRKVLKQLERKHGLPRSLTETKNLQSTQYWSVELRNGEREGLDAMRKRYLNRVTEFPEDHATAQQAYFEQELVDAIKKATCTMAELEIKFERSKQRVANTLQRLVDNGRIIRSSSGTFTLAP